jgi:hypothetical protein
VVGWLGGWGVIEIKANSAQLKLSLEIPKIVAYLNCSAGRTHFIRPKLLHGQIEKNHKHIKIKSAFDFVDPYLF